MKKIDIKRFIEEGRTELRLIGIFFLCIIYISLSSDLNRQDTPETILYDYIIDDYYETEFDPGEAGEEERETFLRDIIEYTSWFDTLSYTLGAEEISALSRDDIIRMYIEAGRPR